MRVGVLLKLLFPGICCLLPAAVLGADHDGDVNIDGDVNVVDLLWGQQALQGTRSLLPAQETQGDVAPLVSGVPQPNGVFNLGDVVTMHFIGWLDDDGRQGKELYNTRREGKPVSFVVGTDRVMPGWSDGVIGMKPGGKRLLLLPPARGYGARGVQDVIPPDAGLMFMIDLIAVEK